MNKKKQALPIQAQDDKVTPPTIQELLQSSENQEREKTLSADERALIRERKLKEKQRERDRRKKQQEDKPFKTNVWLSLDIKTKVERLAEEMGVTKSQVYTYLLYEGLESLNRGDINFEDHLEPSDSPRYEYRLMHPQDNDRKVRLSGNGKGR